MLASLHVEKLRAQLLRYLPRFGQSPQRSEFPEEIRILLRQIEQEEIPERLLKLAEDLQMALSDRLQGKTKP